MAVPDTSRVPLFIGPRFLCRGNVGFGLHRGRPRRFRWKASSFLWICSVCLGTFMRMSVLCVEGTGNPLESVSFGDPVCSKDDS